MNPSRPLLGVTLALLLSAAAARAGSAGIALPEGCVGLVRASAAPRISLDPVAAAQRSMLLNVLRGEIGRRTYNPDLLGVPHRLVLGERSLKDAAIEYRHRRSGAEEKVALGDVLEFLQQRLAGAAPG